VKVSSSARRIQGTSGSTTFEVSSAVVQSHVKYFITTHLYRPVWILLAVMAVFLVACSTPAFSMFLRRSLTKPYPPRAAASYAAADAIVVLGGGWIVDAEDDPEYVSAFAAMTRLGFGRLLYQAGRAPIILLTGGDGEATRMAANLALNGVPPTHVLIEGKSRNTHENALYSAPILHRLGARRILLVTSSRHMGRAAASFRKQGFDVVPAPPLAPASHPVANGFWHSRKWSLIRSADCLHEYLGRWIYALRGWT